MSKIGMMLLLVGLIVVDVIPNIVKVFYAPIAERLVFGYGVMAFGVTIIMIGVVLWAILNCLTKRWY